MSCCYLCETKGVGIKIDDNILYGEDIPEGFFKKVVAWNLIRRVGDKIIYVVYFSKTNKIRFEIIYNFVDKTFKLKLYNKEGVLTSLDKNPDYQTIQNYFTGKIGTR